MLIIGCDYHPGLQQIAFVDTDTDELSQERLAHREQAEQFYRELKQRGIAVSVGMESSGHSRWFERLLQELGFELWIGDPAEVQSKWVPKQKTDRQDAQLLLRLMIEDRFPRICRPGTDPDQQQPCYKNRATWPKRPHCLRIRNQHLYQSRHEVRQCDCYRTPQQHRTQIGIGLAMR